MKNWKTKLAPGLALLAAVALLAGAGGTLASGASAATSKHVATSKYVATSKQITIGISMPALLGAEPQILAGFEKYASALGWKFHVVQDGGNPATQVYQIETLATEGFNAIVIIPDDSSAVCVGVRKAEAEHIPVFTIDRGVIGCKVDMTVESNNFVGGVQAGTTIVQLLTKRYGTPKGTVLQITGDLSQNVAQERGAGFMSVVSKYKGITVITKDGNWSVPTASTIARDVVTEYPNLDAIYMQSDDVYVDPTIAVLKSMHRLYKVGQKGHIIITSVDGSPAGAAAIRAGYTDEMSAQPIPDDGVITHFIQEVLNGQKLHTGTYTKAGALWSPAAITNSPQGMLMQLETTPVTIKNVNLPGLWANQK